MLLSEVASIQSESLEFLGKVAFSATTNSQERMEVFKGLFRGMLQPSMTHLTSLVVGELLRHPDGEQVLELALMAGFVEAPTGKFLRLNPDHWEGYQHSDQPDFEVDLLEGMSFRPLGS